MHDTSKETLEQALAFYHQASPFAPACPTVDLDADVQIIVGLRRALRGDDD